MFDIHVKRCETTQHVLSNIKYSCKLYPIAFIDKGNFVLTCELCCIVKQMNEKEAKFLVFRIQIILLS
jgi:hypothetical protein